jgi:hypothetical protein
VSADVWRCSPVVSDSTLALASVEVTEEDLIKFFEICHLSCELLGEQSYIIEFDNLAVELLTRFVIENNHHFEDLSDLDKSA